jgi:hypothetical protein
MSVVHLRSLGRFGQVENDPFYTGDYTGDIAPVINVDAPPPTLGPNSGTFAPPASTGPLAFPQGPGTVIVPTAPTPAQQAQIAQALTLPPQPGTVQALVQSAPGMLVSQPSPTVAVPLSTSTFGLWLESANLVAGYPNWLVLLGAGVVLSIAGAAFSGKRRKR